MKSFTLDLKEGGIKKLSDINESYIKLKHISTDSFDNLDQQFFIKTSFPDGSTVSKTLSSGAYISPYTRKPEIDIDFSIEDCEFTVIEAVKKNIAATYTFSYETLIDSLSKIASRKDENKYKIKEEIHKWILKTNDLFANITNWLKPYEGSIIIDKKQILLKEEQSDAYTSNTLELQILKHISLRFEPIGTFILGGKGRIDIKTNLRQFDSYMLILQPTPDTEKWFLIKNRDNNTKKEFSQSQLLMLIDNAIKEKGY